MNADFYKFSTHFQELSLQARILILFNPNKKLTYERGRDKCIKVSLSTNSDKNTDINTEI